jgi:hypothetical protein
VQIVSAQIQFLMGPGGAWGVNTTAGTVPTNSWNHVAISRSGSTVYFFVNGAQVGTATYATSLYANGPSYLAFNSGTVNAFTGYISNFRFINGTAVYTAPFVPSAAPVTAITNTQLLLNGANAGVVDNSVISDLETVGSAQISTSVVKYGTGSISFPSTGSYLNFVGRSGFFNGASVAGSNLFFASNTFTIECWIYPTTKVSAASYLSMIIGDANGASGTALYWGVGLNSSGQPALLWYDGASKNCAGGTTIANNTWTYLAFVVTAGAIKIYVNGVSETLTGTTTITTPSGSTGTLVSGVDRANYWFGYLDELRVTNSVARYSTSFTPPGAPFANF